MRTGVKKKEERKNDDEIPQKTQHHTQSGMPPPVHLSEHINPARPHNRCCGNRNNCRKRGSSRLIAIYELNSYRCSRTVNFKFDINSFTMMQLKSSLCRNVNSSLRMMRRELSSEKKMYAGNGVLGIVREKFSLWERRVPLCPHHVADLTNKGNIVLLLILIV